MSINYSAIKYMHVERLFTDEVEDLLVGYVYIFPKIDGTNGVVWYDRSNDEIKAGSRNRELSIESDNAGFCSHIIKQNNIKSYFEKYPNRILYGEWLVPHTLKTYREDCWRKFYVFDVGVMGDEGRTEYLPFDIYSKELKEFDIEFLPPLAIVKNPTLEIIKKYAEDNFYLMKDECIGEGVVCKNYDFYNRYGRQTWGKLVRTEFKENHFKNNGAPVVDILTIEEKIVNEYVTQVVVDKEYEKIKVAENGWKSVFIPRLLNVVFYTLITEESWHFIKQYKNPKIDFKRLQTMTFAKVKELRTDIF